MKKIFTVFATALIMCSSLFTAQAADIAGNLFLGCNGNRNNFGLTGFTRDWQLSTDDGIVYTGTFEFLPVENLQFCFYDVKAEYNDEGICPVEPGNFKIYGPGRPDRFSVINIGFDEGDGYDYIDEGLTFTGDGAWQITDWPGGSISFTVDFSKEESQVTAITTAYVEAGVEMTKTDDETVIFDLQGRRVQNPEKGLYIVNGRLKSLGR